MRKIMLSLFVVLLLPVALIGAADDDSLLNDEDAVVDSGVNFDIPSEATRWPDGREKHFCSCATEAGGEIWCDDRPMYYLIKVQNWGDETTHEVMVIDDLEAYVDYVPGTTEMATQFDENGDGTDWTTLPDGPNGEFPLAGAGYKVAATMAPCDIDTLVCAETRLLRFKVVPKAGLPRNAVIRNQATIKEATTEYLTNSATPLKLNGTWDDWYCQNFPECPEPPKSECGGGGEEPDDDTTAVDGKDAALTDDAAVPDDETITDVDTVKPKDDGCGCSLVW